MESTAISSRIRPTPPTVFQADPVSAISAAGPVGHADEGYAGGGRDEQFTGLSFDFPVGAALSSLAIARSGHGDIWVNAETGDALGINGWTVDVESVPGRISIKAQGLGTKIAHIVIIGVTTGTDLEVNGIHQGSYPAAELRTGVDVLID